MAGEAWRNLTPARRAEFEADSEMPVPVVACVWWRRDTSHDTHARTRACTLHAYTHTHMRRESLSLPQH